MCYLLNEGAGGKLWDSARGVQSSAFIGTPVYRGEGINFVAASTQYIPLTGGLWTNPASFTVSVRLRWTATTTDMMAYTEGSTSSNNPVLLLGTGNIDGSKLRVFVRDDANVTQLNHETTKSFNDGNWHIATFAIRPSGAWLFGVDGVIVASGTAAGITLTLNTATLGALVRAAVTLYFNGDISFMMGWRRALSAAEIASHAAQPFQMFPMWAVASHGVLGGIVPLSTYYRMMGMR